MLSSFLPVDYVRKTDTLVAFFHPQPSYPFHILLVPRRAISRFEELATEDNQFLADLVSCVQSLVKEYELEQKGYRLILNGGSHQDFPQVHFHLISETR
jgi:histidine triad (HIT) family protein